MISKVPSNLNNSVVLLLLSLESPLYACDLFLHTETQEEIMENISQKSSESRPVVFKSWI